MTDPMEKVRRAAEARIEQDERLLRDFMEFLRDVKGITVDPPRWIEEFMNYETPAEAEANARDYEREQEWKYHSSSITGIVEQA